MSLRNKNAQNNTFSHIPHEPLLGGGNILQYLVNSNRESNAPWLFTEKPLIDIDDHLRTEFSINQLFRLAQAWSAWYLEMGVRPRDRVAVYIDDSFYDLIHLFALSQIGAIAVLINGRLPNSSVIKLCRQVKPVGLYADKKRLTSMNHALSTITELRWSSTFEDVVTLKGREIFPSDHYHHASDDPIMICHSSGTTGDPKPVIWTHAQSIAGAKYRASSSIRPSNEVMLSAVPQSHSGAVGFTFYALISGVYLIAIPSQSDKNLADYIELYQPTTVVAFSKTYVDLVSIAKEKNYDLSSVEYWINMGDSAHYPHIISLLNHGRSGADKGKTTEPVFVDGLGSSELGWAILRRTLTRDTQIDPRYIGEPVPFAEVVVLRADGTLASPYEIGMLGVKSTTLSPGYWDDSVSYYRSRLAGYWLSGDLAYMDLNNRYYHVDRAADAIHTEDGIGYSILMEEILLQNLPDISDCAVISGIFNDRTVAVAIVKCNDLTIKTENLLSRANKALRNAAQIELGLLEIASSDSDLPVGATGKILKRLLRKKYEK